MIVPKLTCESVPSTGRATTPTASSVPSTILALRTSSSDAYARDSPCPTPTIDHDDSLSSAR